MYQSKAELFGMFKNLSRSKIMMIQGFIATLLAMTLTQTVQAFAAADPNGFGYAIYDFIVNSLLNGPIGSLIGVGVIIGAVYLMYLNKFVAGILLLAVGIAALKAEALSQSLGYTIPLI